VSDKWRTGSEFVGLLVLAGSLVFVAMQMQQDRKIALVQMNIAQLEMFNARWAAGLESDHYLAMYSKLWGTNAWDTKGMTVEEVAAAEIEAHMWLTYLEGVFESYREGLVTDEAWKEVEEEIRLVGIAPHNRAVFDTLWKPLQSKFTQRADELIKQSLSTQNIVVPGR